MSRLLASMGVLAALVAFYTVGYGGEEQGPIFACSWDKAGSLAADVVADGKDPKAAEPVKVTGTTQVEGKAGQGVLFRGKNSQIQYAIKNFNWRAGTIEFWFKPAWDEANRSQQFRLVQVATPAEGGLNLVMTGTSSFWAVGVQLAVTQGDRQRFMVGGTMLPLTPGVWQHITATWDGWNVWVYVNGVRNGTTCTDERKYWQFWPPEKQIRKVPTTLPASADGVLTLGADLSDGDAESYDQLKVYNYARSPEQVRQDCDKEADLLVEPLLPTRDGVTPRVPVVIYPDEAMSVRLLNTSDRERTVELSWTITDLSTPSFKRKTDRSLVLKLKPKADQLQTVYAPKDEKVPYGLFELEMRATEGWRTVAKRTVIFGAGPRPVDLAKVSPDAEFGFGVWAEGPNALSVPTYSVASVEPLARLGHKWIRTPMFWNHIEPKKGQFDWELTDEIVASAKQHHVSLMPCLACTPDWASSAPEGYTDEQLQTRFNAFQGRRAFAPKDMKDWDNFVFQIVSRYKGTVKNWNIWNEPFGGGFLTGWDAAKKNVIPGGGPEMARLYFDVVKVASLAAKRADPDAKIVIEPMFGTFKDNLLSFEDGAIFKLADVFANHWYSCTSWPETLIPAIQDWKTTLETKAGKKLRHWDTEGGLGFAARLGPRPTTLDRIQDERVKDSKWCYWMNVPVDEWSEARHTVRDYLVKWGEGIDKMIGNGLYGSWHGPNICGWRDGSPLVAALATTELIDALDGAAFVRKLDAPENHYAYLFKKGPEHVLVCWTTLDKSVLNLDLRAATVTVTDMFGNSRSEKTDKGAWIEEVSGSPIYVTGIGGDVRGLPERLKVALAAPFVSVGQQVTLTAEISNSSDRPMQGELSLKLPAGWTAKPAARNVECPAGESTKVVFDLGPSAGVPDGQAEIGAVLTEKALTSAKTVKTTVKTPVAITKMDKPPVIDGDLGKWSKVPPILLNRRDQVKVGLVDPQLLAIQPYLNHKDVWQGAKDLSGEIRLGWDEKNLYIAAKVTDDDVMHKKQIFYQGDGMELFVDLGACEKARPGAAVPKLLQAWFIPPVEGSPNPEYGCYQGVAKLTGIQIASKRTADGYTLEIALPWANIPGFTPAKGALLPVDFAINDADKDHKDGLELKNKIVWHGKDNDWATGENYGLLRLE